MRSLFQGFQKSARVDDPLDKIGEGLRLKALARRLVGDHAFGEVAAHRIARFDAFHRLGTFQNGQPDVDGVAVENACEGIRNDERNAARLDRDGGVLARGAAAEVIF